MTALEIKLEALEEVVNDYDWVPRTSSGKQLSPSSLRNQITKFLATGTITTSAFLNEINVNAASYRRFMSGDYRDQWSACQNGTYWAAARFLATEKIRKQIRARDAKKAAKKTADDNDKPSAVALDSFSVEELEAELAKRRGEKQAPKKRKRDDDAGLDCLSEKDQNAGTAVVTPHTKKKVLIGKARPRSFGWYKTSNYLPK